MLWIYIRPLTISPLYINDLSTISNLYLPIFYADGTTICRENSSNTDLVHNANFIFKNVFLWTMATRISLNVDKTFYIFISTCNDHIGIARNLYRILSEKNSLASITRNYFQIDMIH